MNSLISDLSTEELTVYRFKKGSWKDGRYVRGEQYAFEINASVQQLNANDIRLLPEHRRNTETIKLYTTTRLYNTDEKTGTAADIVIRDNKKFEIHSVENWSIGTDLPHYKSIGVLQDGQGA